MKKAPPRRLVVGLAGAAVDGVVEDDRELLTRVSDAVLLEELAEDGAR